MLFHNYLYYDLEFMSLGVIRNTPRMTNEVVVARSKTHTTNVSQSLMKTVKTRPMKMAMARDPRTTGHALLMSITRYWPRSSKRAGDTFL